jgi:hypothetical protein
MSYNIRLIKSRRAGWARQVAHIEEEEVMEKPERKRPLW